MKVLVLAPPLRAIGGIQNYTANLANALQQIAGATNVRVVAVPSEARPRHDGTGSAAFSPATKFRFTAHALATGLVWRPQLILCAHVGISPLARLLHRLTGAPYWVMLYGIEVWGPLAGAKVDALRAANLLVAISRFTLQAAAFRHGLDATKSAFLAPTFDISSAAPASAHATSQPAANSAPPTVLTVGRLAASERYKGHDVMLDAWPAVLRQVPNARYLIVGDGDDRARLEARARELQLNQSVIFKGALTSAELQDCYDRCSVFALPARTEVDSQTPRGEGFGIVFLEAMAHCKPVIGPNLGAPAEFIHHGEHGLLVDPVDADQLAQAVIDLLRDPVRCEQMGRAGREWVQREYSNEMFRRRLSEILSAHFPKRFAR